MGDHSYFYTYVNFVKTLISLNVDTGISSIENIGKEIQIDFSYNKFYDHTTTPFKSVIINSETKRFTSTRTKFYK